MERTIEGSTAHYTKQKHESKDPGLRQYFIARKNFLFVKRGIDIVSALLVILLIFPLVFPVIIVFIRMGSKGPSFFKQKRVGFLGRTFWCYKFRTMYVNDSADTRQAIKDDPRVTRIGRVLRSTGLDELPQFVNVLLGHMSIVGPRPHMLKDSQEFSNVVANYKFRHLVKPGITGMSQVRGWRGPASTFQSIFRRYQWDAYYVRNINFALDLKIVVETSWLILRSLFLKDESLPEERGVEERGVYDHHASEHPGGLIHSNKIIAD
jgi:putative colanic acid biosynthesis UDP-glucose lipid carrier transferase